jgi:FkbM family methyltransferase
LIMQVAREIKKLLLRAMPLGARARFLAKRPNWRKAAPVQPEFVFPQYLGDLSVNIDTRYKVERIMWTGSYESAFQRWVAAHVKPGWTCIDVGANVGAITLGLAKAVGGSGRVLAIEPGANNLRRMQRNFDLNPALRTRVAVEACGISDVPGELTWVEELENPGNAMLEHSPLYAKQAAGAHVKVPVDRLDQVVHKHAIDAVHLIKIDVEGMEINVLRGATHILSTHKPILFLETLDRYSRGDGGGKLEEIRSLLAPLGYGFYRVHGDGTHGGVTPPPWPDYTLAIASN